MKKIKIIIAILSVSFSCSISFAANQTPLPDLNPEYGIAMDHLVCTSNLPITPEMEQELSDLMPKFKSLWAQDGTVLLTNVISLLKKDFEKGRKEITLDFLLCGNISSMSFPLLIKARGYLKSANPNPYASFYLVYEVFHEMLHRYLWQNFQPIFSNSELLKKYQNESETVKFHLHLMALVKYVYLSLHKDSELQDIIKWESTSTNPSYQRSWEIVNQEGYQPFIKELSAQS